MIDDIVVDPRGDHRHEPFFEALSPVGIGLFAPRDDHLAGNEINPVGLVGRVGAELVEPCAQRVDSRYYIGLESRPHLRDGDIGFDIDDALAEHAIDVFVGEVAPCGVLEIGCNLQSVAHLIVAQATELQIVLIQPLASQVLTQFFFLSFRHNRIAKVSV